MEPDVEVPVVDFDCADELVDCSELVAPDGSGVLLLLVFVLESDELSVDELDDCEDDESAAPLFDGVVEASDDELDDSDEEFVLFCFAVLLDVGDSLLPESDESFESESVSEPVDADTIGA